jgi:hypothetical protein
MNHKMKKIIIILSLVLILNFNVFSINWKNSPSSCPTEYNFVSCTGGQKQCGIETGSVDAPFCFDMSNLNAPSSSTTSNTDVSNLYDGGYLVNCDATDGSAPFCDNSGNFWCDRNNECYSTKKRSTTCLGGSFGAYECGSCRSGYLDCDGDGNVCEIIAGQTPYKANSHYVSCNTFACNYGYADLNGDGSGNDSDGCEVQIGGSCGNNAVLDSQGNCGCAVGYTDCNGEGIEQTDGCEILSGSSCEIGGVIGTYDICSCQINNVDYGTSGTEYLWSGGNPFLWLKQLGSGDVFKFTDKNNVSFSMNETGVFYNGTVFGGGNITISNESVSEFNETKLNETIDIRTENKMDKIISINNSILIFNGVNGSVKNSPINITGSGNLTGIECLIFKNGGKICSFE